MKNKKDSKMIVDKYTQPIYIPNTLYVVKNYTKEKLDKLFEYPDHSSIYEEGLDGLTCRGVVDKKTGLYCMVVLLSNDFFERYKDILDFVDIASHEGFHVADRILEYSGDELVAGNEETYAFMTGWATKCIFKTMRK